MSKIKLVDMTTRKTARKPIPPVLLVAGVAISIGFSWYGLQVAAPLRQAMRIHAENDAMERHLRNLDIQNQSERKLAESMETDQGKIIAARSRGYMFKNERPLHIQNDPAPPGQ